MMYVPWAHVSWRFSRDYRLTEFRMNLLIGILYFENVCVPPNIKCNTEFLMRFIVSGRSMEIEVGNEEDT